MEGEEDGEEEKEEDKEKRVGSTSASAPANIALPCPAPNSDYQVIFPRLRQEVKQMR